MRWLGYWSGGGADNDVYSSAALMTGIELVLIHYINIDIIIISIIINIIIISIVSSRSSSSSGGGGTSSSSSSCSSVVIGMVKGGVVEVANAFKHSVWLGCH